MKNLKVNLKERSYQIIIGQGVLKSLGALVKKAKIGSDAYIITNSLIKRKYGALVENSLKKAKISVKFKTVPDSEKAKSFDVALSVIKDITKYSQDRRIFIIALGGGVIGDLSGFVASVYKRGIAYIQIPTTLLAQIDSSIGGKTAIDLVEGKNLVGAFYQPRMVISDLATLKTLSLRQIRAGLAEAIKYGIIKDKPLFDYLEKNYRKILKSDRKGLEFLVYRCSRIKAAIVSLDEKEKKGLRTILNFGHTLGHAIETAANYKSYNHGEAVALGMLCATYISLRLGMIDSKVYKRIEDIIASFGLPTMIKKLEIDKIVEAHYRDKKFIGKRNRFVLIKSIGKTQVKMDIPLELIKAALLSRF